jgi:NDP-sugar pyrophosphorylase family protein
MQLVIPMSGVGQRFIDKGYKLPKPFIEISGKPIVQHVVEMFPGVEEVLFIVNREHFEDKELNVESRLTKICPKAKIAVIDPHKLGPAWAILQASNDINLNSPVVVNYCDFACTWDYSRFREILESGVDGLIATYSGFHPHMLRNTQYAYLKLNQFGDLIGIQEKLSFTSNPMHEPASSGTYGFGSGQILLDAISNQVSSGDSYNNEYYTSLTYKNMIAAGQVIKSFQIEKFFQWGTPEDFEDFKNQKDFFTYKLSRHALDIEVDRVEILAAGAGERFSVAGYKENKPFLPVGNSLLSLQAMEALRTRSNSLGILLQESQLISSHQLEMFKSNRIQIRKVSELTKGQAVSALISLSSGLDGNCIVGTCDSLVFPRHGLQLTKGGKTIGVWVTRPSNFALNNPMQFGWVDIDEYGNISNSWIKEEPPFPQDKYVITGTFYFANVLLSIELLKLFLAQGNTINSEYYLDSLLEFAKQEGWHVFALIPEWFISLGTPDEYETYLYWEKLFSQRTDLLVHDET